MWNSLDNVCTICIAESVFILCVYYIYKWKQFASSRFTLSYLLQESVVFFFEVLNGFLNFVGEVISLCPSDRCIFV